MMEQYLIMGLVLGLSAGLSPGPLLTLVISETLSQGVAAGIRVALAPLISDLPVVVLSLAVLSKLSDFNQVLGIISLVGGAVILKMGISGLRTSGVVLESEDRISNPLLKGVMVNILSPHPYLFWISVGAPATGKAWSLSPAAAVGFVGSFYLLLVGSKLVLALVVGRTRSFLTGRVYIYTMKTLGLILCALAVLLSWEGIGLLGWL
ncbi:MAG: LysE family transporter [Desulfobacterales bacterium]|nr:LysE family transporter [Desulfobacterales bacterium]